MKPILVVYRDGNRHCMQYQYFGQHSGETEQEIIQKAKRDFRDKMEEQFDKRRKI